MTLKSVIHDVVVRNYRDLYEKRCCSGSHKQCKTIFKDHMVRFKIISLYIYKDLRLKKSVCEGKKPWNEDAIPYIRKLLFGKICR